MTFVIDPRVFISGPFERCAVCGQQSYGTLSITGNRRHRECRECRASGYEELPRLRKRVIYIDQFALSNMMKAIDATAKGHARTAADPFWLRLFESLERLCKLQLAICPASEAHTRESLMVDFYAAIKRMSDQLSHGIAFHEEYIRELQIHTAARAWAKGEQARYDFDAANVVDGDLHGWHERIIIGVSGGYPESLVESIRAERDRIGAEIESLYNRGYVNAPNIGYRAWLQRENERAPEAMLLAHEAWLNRAKEIYSGERPFDLDELMPPPAVQRLTVIARVMGEHFGGSRQHALSKVGEFLRSSAFAEIPYIAIAHRLWAVIAMKASAGQKKAPNRGTVNDIAVVSTLLPYCDAMLLDHPCLAMIEDIPRDFALPYPTRLFSTRRADELFDYLADIERQADPAVLATVERVYGPDWATPFLTMYDVERQREEQRNTANDL
jgi:hypothetical protein